MLLNQSINGMSLPDKTICLTFDDGPGESHSTTSGPKSIELAEYLNQQGIPGTFFIVGKHAAQYPYMLPAIARCGHLIGNHTFNHPNLIECLNTQGDIVSELESTDQIIQNHLSYDTVYFRAPYGLWAPELAKLLNEIPNIRQNYLGPYSWDINAEDWRYWSKGINERQCADHYLREIFEKRRGIVLFHDSTADNCQIKENNRTFETIRLLIPELKALGYKFARLDEI
jgi:peptidoglycan/xylan/chitin deacetylase (PgdA/CDA1 family)